MFSIVYDSKLPSISTGLIITVVISFLSLIVLSLGPVKLVKSPAMRARYDKLKENRQKNLIPKTVEIVRANKAKNLDTDLRVKNLKEILQISNKMKIQDAADILEIDRLDLLKVLIENKEILVEFKIDGDYILVTSNEDVKSFISVLDDQFQAWNKKGKK